MNYTKGERINFVELDKQGNYIIRLTGGSKEEQEQRIEKMLAAEDMYEALGNNNESLALAQDILDNTVVSSPVHAEKLIQIKSQLREIIANNEQALAKAEGRG